MTDELKAAAERYGRRNSYSYCVYHDLAYQEQHVDHHRRHKDMALLADAYLNDLAAREAQAGDDAKPARGSVDARRYTDFCERLDALPKGERIEAIDDAIHRLQFERRWQQMAPNQIKHMCDESLSDAESEALAACKTDAEREDRINMYARARYFRRCHWRMYLNGESSEPPVEADDSV